MILVWGCDAIMDEPRVYQAIEKAWDPLDFSNAPITRGRSKLLKEALQGLMVNHHGRLEGLGVPKEEFKNMIQVEEK